MSTVLIGHASISEKGTVNGSKGDSTGKEVCTRTWYSKPWDYMAIHPDANVREKHAKAVEDACANNYIGYGQSGRNTANTEAKKVNYDISKIKTKCNTDCSALQNLAAVVSGAKGVTYGSNGWTTSTMKSALKSAGYIIIEDKSYLTSADYCVRGAIYVKSGSHTVCGLTNGSKASQTLSKAGLSSASTTSTSTNTSSTTKTTVTYTSHRIADNKWGNEITGYNTTNSMGYSGVIGKSIDKVTIKLSQGIITYTAHRTDGKWGGEITGYSTADTTKYAGSTNKPIDAIAIKASGIVGILKYRVHRKTDNKWGNWITGYSKTDTNKYAGSFGKEIDAIQIGIE